MAVWSLHWAHGQLMINFPARGVLLSELPNCWGWPTLGRTLFRKPIEMDFFNIQVLLKSSEVPEFRNNQYSGLNEKFWNSWIQKEFGGFSSDHPEIIKKKFNFITVRKYALSEKGGWPVGRPAGGWSPKRHIVMTPWWPSHYFPFRVPLIMEFTRNDAQWAKVGHFLTPLLKSFCQLWMGYDSSTM
jgi:hypothetical protein